MLGGRSWLDQLQRGELKGRVTNLEAITLFTQIHKETNWWGALSTPMLLEVRPHAAWLCCIFSEVIVPHAVGSHAASDTSGPRHGTH